MSESFWGIIPEVIVATPHSILVEQGEFLRKFTGGLLRGHLKRSSQGSRFFLDFYIEVERLNNYRFHLFRVMHDVILYPLTIQQGGVQIASCSGEEEFRTELRGMLSSDETRKIVQALLAQAKDEDAEGEVPF